MAKMGTDNTRDQLPHTPEGGAAVKKEGQAKELLSQALGRERGKGKVAESALLWL